MGRVQGSRRRAELDRFFAWLILVVGVGRIGIALVRHEDAGAEVGLATAFAMLSAYELARIWRSNRVLPP